MAALVDPESHTIIITTPTGQQYGSTRPPARTGESPMITALQGARGQPPQTQQSMHGRRDPGRHGRCQRDGQLTADEGQEHQPEQCDVGPAARPCEHPPPPWTTDPLSS